MRNIFKRKKKLDWIEPMPKIKEFEALYRNCVNCGKFKANDTNKYCSKCLPIIDVINKYKM